MLSLLSKDSAPALDTLIAEERKRYALEHIDFHTFFWRDTVPRIQMILRRQVKPTESCDARKHVIGRLYGAQRSSPHRLWELLLASVVAPTLRRRRRALAPSEDAHKDELVWSTFVYALQNLPWSVPCSDMQRHVMRVSREALAARLQQERRSAARKVATRATARKARAASTDITANTSARVQ